jgi:porin
MSLAGAETPDYNTDTLTGDWAGLRAERSEQGWNWDFGLRLDQMSVVRGGISSGGRPLSHLDIKLATNLEKILEWQGTTAFFNLIDDRGGKTNADHVGSLLGVTSIEVPVSTTRLFHAWIQKEWAEGQVSLLTGIYPIDSEFMVMESAGIFLQPSYGPVADLGLSRGPSIFNNAAFGLRGKWASADRSFYVQTAILDGVPGDPKHPTGTHVKLDVNDGIMSILEIGHRPVAEITGFDLSAGEERPESTSSATVASPGYAKYALGLWGYSKRSDDLVDVDSAGRPAQRRSVGWYALAEKTVFTETAIGDIAIFARYSQNDGNSIALERTVNLGINLKGPINGRDNDVAAIGYSTGIVANKYRTFLESNGIAAAKFEGALELTYRFQADRWLAVQPVFQWIRHPGADRGIRDAAVMGLRLDLAL